MTLFYSMNLDFAWGAGAASGDSTGANQELIYYIIQRWHMRS